MTSLVVDGIQFDFDDSWQVAKWDDSPWYRDGIERLKETWTAVTRARRQSM